MQTVRSSYAENNYGTLLAQYVSTWKPKVLVELGILDGYSTMHIAKGLRESGSDAHLDAYDLFGDYTYKHGTKSEVESMLTLEGIRDFVNIIHGNAYLVHANYSASSIDFLHIDISNTGRVIRDLLTLWQPKMSKHAMIVLEGGSAERDQVDWMLEYDMAPIKPEIESNPIIAKHYDWHTHLAYPSMTVLKSKAT